ncbi:MAG: OmpA family protein [Flavobacteriales bacterium]|nr:OmpA family protein [Flavobacteriales bacterium]
MTHPLRWSIPLVLLFTGTALKAQQNIGLASGNYAGISGAWLNPASIVDSRYKFDMTLFGYESYFANNALLMSNKVLRDRLFSKAPYNASHEQAVNDQLTPLDNLPEKVEGSIVSEIQAPFSFMARTGDGSSIGLNIRNRTGFTVGGLDRSTAEMLYYNLESPNLYGVVQDNSGFNFSFMNWMEMGFTYGRVLVRSDHHFLKAAVTLKALAGSASLYLASDDLKITFDGPDTLSVQSPLVEYGRTERGDFDTYQRRNLLNGVEDWAMGWDAGLVYELRGNIAKGRYLDLDNEVKERLDLNKYIVRIGVSLLDAGKFTYTRRALAQDYSADITGWDISQVNASDLDQWDTAFAELVNYVPNGSPTYTHRLPTAIAANIDLHAFGGFYINVGTYLDATGLFKEASTTLRPTEWVAVTPRFENRWLGLYVPISTSAEQTRIGATVRIGPVYFGSNNLADQLANEQNPQADYHFGVRFSIGQGKPSALKRRYEHLRKQQEGINRNSVRIDSLEREVYALKMVVMTDRNGAPTVVNNFFGNDSAAMALLKDSTMARTMAGGGEDREQARLKAENEYLMDQLARTSIQQRQDSAYIANLENADGKKDQDRVKAEREANKIATKQADATADMAKELERIDKRMQRQNTILLAGATTAVVAAATSGDKKDDKKSEGGAATYVNDSTIVLNGDTLRLLIPAAADSARKALLVADTVRIVVRDTVRTQQVLRDTVRVTEQAPGTIHMDEAERQRLMEPVYFATGKTTLGPQGNMKVAEIAAWLKKHPEARVQVTGVADASGSVTANEAVAQKRADSVRQALVANGIAAARITTQRQLAPAGATPDPKDRRADVKFMP